jgi:hypothetical protein
MSDTVAGLTPWDDLGERGKRWTRELRDRLDALRRGSAAHAAAGFEEILGEFPGDDALRGRCLFAAVGRNDAGHVWPDDVIAPDMRVEEILFGVAQVLHRAGRDDVVRRIAAVLDAHAHHERVARRIRALAAHALFLVFENSPDAQHYAALARDEYRQIREPTPDEVAAALARRDGGTQGDVGERTRTGGASLSATAKWPEFDGPAVPLSTAEFARRLGVPARRLKDWVAQAPDGTLLALARMPQNRVRIGNRKTAIREDVAEFIVRESRAAAQRGQAAEEAAVRDRMSTERTRKTAMFITPIDAAPDTGRAEALAPVDERSVEVPTDRHRSHMGRR